ncbi:F0F1 ATP synthase subunit A [bacterium]|nr:F0F1 ATP synthase subunit A [bacterium]
MSGFSDWWHFFFPGASGLNITISPGVLFHLGPLPVTTTLILQLVVIALICSVMISARVHWQKIPSKFQVVIEWLVMAVYNQVQGITGNHERTRKIFPLAFCLFTFILVANLLTLFPGLGAISYGNINLFRSVLADYSMILVMTLIVIITCQVAFIMTNGLGKYLKKFFNFSSPIAFFLGLMDVVGELAKILSLSFRLFGNVFAGDVLMAVVTALLPYFIPFPFFALTTFSSVIQAYVFALLSTIFINSSLDVVES